MKKLAAGVGVLALVVVAHFAFAQDNTRSTTQSGSSMTVTGTDMCAGWTKGGGASVGKANPGKEAAGASSSSMDASTAAACEAAASSSSSSASAQSYTAKQGKTGATK